MYDLGHVMLLDKSSHEQATEYFKIAQSLDLVPVKPGLDVDHVESIEVAASFAVALRAVFKLSRNLRRLGFAFSWFPHVRGLKRLICDNARTLEVIERRDWSVRLDAEELSVFEALPLCANLRTFPTHSALPIETLQAIVSACSQLQTLRAFSEHREHAARLLEARKARAEPLVTLLLQVCRFASWISTPMQAGSWRRCSASTRRLRT